MSYSYEGAGVLEELDCLPHPFDNLAGQALYQTVE